MNLQDLKRLNTLLADFTWYGETFLQTGTGLEWGTIGGRDYFATAWMEFFKGINDGTYHRLAEAVTDAPYISHFRKEVEERLNPLLGQLDAMEVERGLHKIKVRIDVGKFKHYETKLKQMSADGIIFDIIQDDDDIRETYFIDGDPEQIRSYLMHGIREVIDRYTSAEQAKIRELESRVRKLENNLREKSTLLTHAKERQKDLEEKNERARKELEVSGSKIEHLEESIARFIDDEVTEEPEGNDIRENSKLRMYYLYKLGFLDDAIWNGNIPQKVRAQIIGTILDAGPLKADTAIRYYKFFNSTGSAELREYDSKNEQRFFDYVRKNCPDIEFQKGQPINRLRKTN